MQRWKNHTCIGLNDCIELGKFSEISPQQAKSKNHYIRYFSRVKSMALYRSSGHYDVRTSHYIPRPLWGFQMALYGRHELAILYPLVLIAQKQKPRIWDYIESDTTSNDKVCIGTSPRILTAGHRRVKSIRIYQNPADTHSVLSCLAIPSRQKGLVRGFLTFTSGDFNSQ